MNAHAPIAPIEVTTADQTDEAVAAFVRAHPQATPFHLPQWSRAIAAGTGQRAHLLVAKRVGEIVGLLPLTEMRSPLFGAALVSTGFGVDGGILSVDAAPANPIAGEAIRLADRLGCPSIELRGGPCPDGWHVSRDTYAGFARDLPQDDEAILTSIPRKQRAEVRRALGFGLDVAIGRDPGPHYRAYAESVRNLGTPVFPRALFESVLGAFGEDADILTVSRGGQPLASVLSLYFNGTVYPYWGGGTRMARAARANELMYYELMRHAAARGCTRFDFGRSKFGTGAFAFKKNWGFEPQPLAYARWGERREVNPLNPRYRLQVALWQRLPLWLANRLGPPIARGLG
ncbi:FemAB family PEP-CTERM system-associated protein [Sphingosinicella sp. LHD-64]|uniref:FemAB family XrtA/PEP-CTERM system-associated protein n=1 Tax=Sphingosinicella sp. LHD-64 TaxID=3072139 RepID=UPI00280F62DA|nr:FemAB family XrtA/PEP-CTERM system-associated protein [Sphingosinicella sp. LHD-64]MDQ8754687.1 FemAB family PEP-CTERM system-associated protein [Sphingosinicella sp. LHD-64]